jgi:hypothetical protein
MLGSPSPLYSILKRDMCLASSKSSCYQFRHAKLEFFVVLMIESRLVGSQALSTSNYFAS